MCQDGDIREQRIMRDEVLKMGKCADVKSG